MEEIIQKLNIVQIGTNRANDDVTELVNQYSNYIEKLILVEPLIVHHSTIEQCYNKYTQKIIDS